MTSLIVHPLVMHAPIIRSNHYEEEFPRIDQQFQLVHDNLQAGLNQIVPQDSTKGWIDEIMLSDKTVKRYSWFVPAGVTATEQHATLNGRFVTIFAQCDDNFRLRVRAIESITSISCDLLHHVTTWTERGRKRWFKRKFTTRSETKYFPLDQEQIAQLTGKMKELEAASVAHLEHFP
jgi:hypothetical protein